MQLCGVHGVGCYREGVSRVATTTATVTLQLLDAEKHLTEQKKYQTVLSIPYSGTFYFSGKILRSRISLFRH